MKKIISFFLLLTAYALTAQTSAYWTAFDAQFNSGVKYIDLDRVSINGNVSYPTVITLDDNSVYYFTDVNSTAVKISPNLPDTLVKEAHILCSNDTSYIFILTQDNKLFESSDLGQNWHQIYSEIGNSEINSIAIPKKYIDWSGQVLIGAGSNGAYLSADYGQNWFPIQDGLGNNKIKELFEEENYIYCLTDYKKTMYFDYHNLIGQWTEDEDLSSYNGVNNIKILGGRYYFFDNNNNLNELEPGYHLITFSDSISATCFDVHDDWTVITIFNTLKIPMIFNPLVGTKNHGIYAEQPLADYLLSPLSSELTDEEISFIVFSKRGPPELCLVGTKSGKIYYDSIEIPTAVKDVGHNELNSKIYPQPANEQAGIFFTLPYDSKVCVKLYNPIGMEIKQIANGYFNSGENSVPLDLSKLNNGLYIVSIDYSGGRVFVKVIK